MCGSVDIICRSPQYQIDPILNQGFDWVFKTDAEDRIRYVFDLTLFSIGVSS